MPTCEFILENGYECETRIEEGNVCWAHEGHKCKVQKCRVLKVRDCNDFCLSHYKQWMNEMADKAKEIEKEQKQKEKEKVKREKEEAKAAAKKSKKEAGINKNLPSFEVLKQKFELNHFLCKGDIWRLESNGEFTFLTPNKATIEYKNWEFNDTDSEGNIVQKSFFPEWLKHPERKGYSRVDFIPNVDECPDDVFNMFKGLRASRLDYDMSVKEIEDQIKPIIDHANYITSGYGKELITQFARIAQRPWEKTNIATLIRDTNKLFNFGGGAGKNLFMDFFGEKIIGEEYYHVISDNAELYDSFNSELSGKLVVFVEEAAGKDNFKNNNTLKSTITKKKLRVNAKGQNHYKVNDYSNWFFTTNERNAIPITFGERRWQIFDSLKDKKGDSEYFNSLIECMNQEKTAYAFYTFIMNIDAPHVGDASSIIKTAAYYEIQRMNAPGILRLLSSIEAINLVKNPMLSRELYSYFATWAKLMRESKDETIMSNSSFSRWLTGEGDNFVTKKHSNKGEVFTINRQKLVEELKRLNLLEETFNLEEIDKMSNEYQEPKTAGDMLKSI